MPKRKHPRDEAACVAYCNAQMEKALSNRFSGMEGTPWQQQFSSTVRKVYIDTVEPALIKQAQIEHKRAYNRSLQQQKRARVSLSGDEMAPDWGRTEDGARFATLTEMQLYLNVVVTNAFVPHLRGGTGTSRGTGYTFSL